MDNQVNHPDQDQAMNKQDQRKAIAELDGNYITDCNGEGMVSFRDYLTSRDAIVRAIAMQPRKVQLDVVDNLMKYPEPAPYERSLRLLMARPEMICEALLRATNKWKP